MRIVNITLVAVAAFLVFFFVLGVSTLVEDVSREINAPEKLYTVKTADAVYLDLSKERNNGNWASYRTTTGKRIIFNGTFTEIEE